MVLLLGDGRLFQEWEKAEMKHWSRSVNTIISDGTKLTLLEDNSHVQRWLWWNVIKTWTWQYFFTPLPLYSFYLQYLISLLVYFTKQLQWRSVIWSSWQTHPLFGFEQARLFAMRSKDVRKLCIVTIKQVMSCKLLTYLPIQTHINLFINIIIDITVWYYLLMIHNKYCNCSLKTVWQLLAFAIFSSNSPI